MNKSAGISCEFHQNTWIRPWSSNSWEIQWRSNYIFPARLPESTSSLLCRLEESSAQPISSSPVPEPRSVQRRMKNCSMSVQKGSGALVAWTWRMLCRLLLTRMLDGYKNQLHLFCFFQCLLGLWVQCWWSRDIVLLLQSWQMHLLFFTYQPKFGLITDIKHCQWHTSHNHSHAFGQFT